jgi:uncharacterized protein with ACT and thioredoxin-like domain
MTGRDRQQQPGRWRNAADGYPELGKALPICRRQECSRSIRHVEKGDEITRKWVIGGRVRIMNVQRAAFGEIERLWRNAERRSVDEVPKPGSLSRGFRRERDA